MNIAVQAKVIETDEEGYWLNRDDWSDEVAENTISLQGQQAYLKFLYDIVPYGPVQDLCKLARLPKPLTTIKF